jgi:hypothetical protein
MMILADQPEVHTCKAMVAAMEICMLIKVPSPIAKHTPFFTCAINLAAVVYLSYWSFIATEEGDGLVKEHIKLNIGSLKQLARCIPIAQTVLTQAKGVAKDLFQSRKALNNMYLGSTTREEILQRMIDLPDDDAHASVGTVSTMSVTPPATLAESPAMLLPLPVSPAIGVPPHSSPLHTTPPGVGDGLVTHHQTAMYFSPPDMTHTGIHNPDVTGLVSGNGTTSPPITRI